MRRVPARLPDVQYGSAGDSVATGPRAVDATGGRGDPLSLRDLPGAYVPLPRLPGVPIGLPDRGEDRRAGAAGAGAGRARQEAAAREEDRPRFRPWRPAPAGDA